MSITETFGPLPTVLILGAARHGKDTAAELLSELTGWAFRSSSLFVAEHAVLPTLGPKYGYDSVEECYDDRQAHREEWRDLIRAYNQNDRAKLAKKLLTTCSVYVGMRCHMEYAECMRQEVFDYVLWVDASDRVGGHDPSLTIHQDDFFMHTIDNNGTPEDLKKRLERWLRERQ